MRARNRFTVAAALLALGLSRQAAAQEDDRVRVNLGAGGQFSTVSFTTTTTRAVYLENEITDTSYRVRRSPLVDVGISVRVAGSFGVGLAITGSTAKIDADVSAAIPHPFFYKTPRTVTGTASGLQHDEIGAHLQLFYAIQPSDKLEVVISGGPSIVRVRQQIVTDVAFTDTYPYDTAGFTSASSQRVSSNNAVGFNAGVDVAKRLSRHAGIGGGARWVMAKTSLTLPNSTTVVTVDAGGAQLSGGLRLYF